MARQAPDSDARSMELFQDAIREAGGLRRLVRERRLGWLPALFTSAEVLVLQEQEQVRPDEIAQRLSLNSESVVNFLSGPADRAGQCVDTPPPQSLGDRELAAGGLVRRVWQSGEGRGASG